MKQLKSTSQNLRELFESSITVMHLTEKLQFCHAEDDAQEIHKRMEELNFDVFGLKDKGEIHGYVERKNLEDGHCRDYQRIFHPSELIAESTPLINVLPLLRYSPRMFVLKGNQVVGIVTRGDLQKAPVRMLLFGLVTLLEMNLLKHIRMYYENDSWKSHLKEERLKKTQKLFNKRQARNEAIDLADCLQFCDKRDLILRSPRILERFKFESKNSGESLLKKAEKLRDKLAHGQDISKGSSWPEIIDLMEKIEELLIRIEKS